MTQLKPPRIATWLLNRLVSGHRRESLLGDLVEHYQHGRTSAWFWRQALTAISVGAVADIHEHRLLSLRGVISGFVVLYLGGFIATRSSFHAGQWVWNWTVDHDQDTLRVLWFTFGLHLHVMTCLACAASGWTVARFHHRSTVVAYLACVLLLNPVAFYLMSPQLWRFIWLSASLRFSYGILLFVAMPVSILLGGLWGARPDGHPPPEIPIR